MLSGYLYDCFDEGLVGADLGALQSAHLRTDPRNQHELGALAHFVTHHDPHEPELSLFICTT